MNGNKFENVVVNVKNVPLLNSFSPISISPSSKSQTINLNFENAITDYTNKISFVGNKKIDATCTADSNYALSCSAVFDVEDEYYITIDGVNTGSFINVSQEDNINDNEKRKNNGISYLKVSSLLLSLLLLF